MDLKVSDLLRECNGKLICGDENIILGDFCKDTRLIKDNDVYVGIKGENFDGNTLYEQAFENGAKVCILEHIENSDEAKEKYADKVIVIVEDSVKALQQLAAYKRSLYDIPVIAVTGSVGKTSARDMVASVVGTKFNVLKTQGNYNNHIGLPLTILGLRDHEALVVEMGMNHFGEISVLTKIAKPDIAIITNVGTAHIGNLGSREGILKAKLEILEGLKDDGVLVINNDNDMLNKWYMEQEDKSHILTFGMENESDVLAENIKINETNSTFEVSDGDKKVEITVPVAGAHYIYHALLGILIGKKLNIPIEKIKEGIEGMDLTKGRMQLINLKEDVILINDCYNANYDSMKAAIDYLGKVENRRRIAILGDMLELGEYSEELHTKVGEEVKKNNIEVLITVGEMGKVIFDVVNGSNTEVYNFDNNEDAIAKVKEIMNTRDIILVKASNGMKFKEIVEALQESK